MSRAVVRQNLLGLVDTDSDDDLLGAGFAAEPKETALKKPSNRMPAAPKKGAKAKGRAAANKVTKPTRNSSTRRASGRIAAALEQESDREALAEKEPNQPVVAPKRGRKAATKAAPPSKEAEEEEEMPAALVSPPDSDRPKTKARGARGRPKAAAKPQKDVVDETPEPKAPAATAKRGRKPAPAKAKAREPSPEIPETQQADPMDVEPEEDTHMEDATELSRDDPPARLQRPITTSPSKGTRLDSEDSDSSLRRRLGDMTRKYDALEAKYRDLREIGVKEADRNFDRLKKQGEERAKSANDVITKLKAELAAQKELAGEGQQHKKELDLRQAQKDALESQVAGLEAALAAAKKEMKTLATRLAASRTVETVPGSALKAGLGAAGRGGAAGAAAAAAAEAAQVAQAAQLKEDLYGDLTGLIIRGVKRTGEEDVYDCIQTGRNGTLHFKLSIGNDMSAENYDEMQFMYMPQLDPSRDRALIDMLPDYLVEEISFPRPHAAKFYERVLKSLTEKVE